MVLHENVGSLRFLSEEPSTCEAPATSRKTGSGTGGGSISSHLTARQGEAAKEAKTEDGGDVLLTTRRESAIAFERDSLGIPGAR